MISIFFYLLFRRVCRHFFPRRICGMLMRDRWFWCLFAEKIRNDIERSLEAYFEVKEKRITAVHSTANNWKRKKNLALIIEVRFFFFFFLIFNFSSWHFLKNLNTYCVFSELIVFFSFLFFPLLCFFRGYIFIMRFCWDNTRTLKSVLSNKF